MLKNIIIIRFVIVALFAQTCNTMSMKQIKQTGKTIRKTCLPKVDVEEAKVDVIKEGTFIEEQGVMCYIACIMKTINTIKNGKVNYEAAMKQADMMLPDEIREPAKAALTKCRKVPEQYKDLCESAFHTAKCIYNADPDIFFFP